MPVTALDTPRDQIPQEIEYWLGPSARESYDELIFALDAFIPDQSYSISLDAKRIPVTLYISLPDKHQLSLHNLVELFDDVRDTTDDPWIIRIAPGAGRIIAQFKYAPEKDSRETKAESAADFERIEFPHTSRSEVTYKQKIPRYPGDLLLNPDPKTFIRTLTGIADTPFLDLVTIEASRRKLHLDALTKGMHEHGFTNYNATEAFILASLYSHTLLSSQPIIASTEQIKGYLGLNEDVLQSSGKVNPFTYVKTLYGLTYSFGFSDYRSIEEEICINHPIIGLDTQLIREMDQVMIKSERGHPERTEKLLGHFRSIMGYLWRTAAFTSHDYIHNTVTDVSDVEFSSNFLKLTAAPFFADLDAQYVVKLSRLNESQATRAHGDALFIVDRDHHGVRPALVRQTLQFFDDVHEFSRRGLSIQATTYLLFAGLLHAQIFLDLNAKEGDNSSLLETASSKFKSLTRPCKYVDDDLPIFLSALKLSGFRRDGFDKGPIAPIELLDFSVSSNQFNMSHHYHLLAALNSTYEMLIGISTEPAATVPENSYLSYLRHLSAYREK